MAKYQRQTTSPNSGKRHAARMVDKGSRTKGSECISRMPDGKVYLFSPTRTTRKERQTTQATKIAKSAEVARMGMSAYDAKHAERY